MRIDTYRDLTVGGAESPTARPWGVGDPHFVRPMETGRLVRLHLAQRIAQGLIPQGETKRDQRAYARLVDYLAPEIAEYRAFLAGRWGPHLAATIADKRRPRGRVAPQERVLCYVDIRD